jgi:hypothetical protein
MYKQIGDRETDEPLAVVHEALVSCKDLAADAVDREAEVARPVAQYRLEKVNQALVLVRQATGPKPEAIEVLMRLVANKLSTLPPDQWVRWTHHLLKTLAEEVTEVEYCSFLEALLADVGKQLEELQGCVPIPDLRDPVGSRAT